MSGPRFTTPYSKLVSQLTSDSYVQSYRRGYYVTRDLGLAEASNGDIGMNVHRVSGTPQPTGWHYHECHFQIVYVLAGWSDLQFEDGESVRLTAGDCVNIPAGMRHNETAASEDYEALELTSPPRINTIDVDGPDGDGG